MVTNTKKVLARLFVGAMLTVSLLATTHAVTYAASIECTILPQAICDSTQRPELSTDPEGTAVTPNENGSTDSSPVQTDVKNSGIVLLLSWIIKILTAGVGILAVAALVYAGILYSSAGGDSSKVQQAKTVITNTVIGLISYGLMAIFLNFLVPGGVFG